MEKQTIIFVLFFAKLFIELAQHRFGGTLTAIGIKHLHCHDDHLFNKTFAEYFKQIDQQRMGCLLGNQFECRLRKILCFLNRRRFRSRFGYRRLRCICCRNGFLRFRYRLFFETIIFFVDRCSLLTATKFLFRLLICMFENVFNSIERIMRNICDFG